MRLTKFDRLLLYPAAAFALFAFLLASAFFLTFSPVGPGGLLKGLVEALMIRIKEAFQTHIPSPVLCSFVGEGIVGSVGGVLCFVPQIAMLFLFLTLLEESGLSPFQAEDVRACINRKDTMNAERLLKKAGVSGDALNNILALPALFGGREVFSVAEALTHNSCARRAVDDLKNIDRLLTAMGYEGYISYDLGMIKPLSYYSGILFSGLVKDLGAPVLSGGRYDNLADAFGKHMPAVGFAMGLKRILVALERQGALPEEKKPLVIVAEEGQEAPAYHEFLARTERGERVRLSALTGKEGVKQEEDAGYEVLPVGGNA